MPGLYWQRNRPVCEGAHTIFVRIRKPMSRLKISAISYLNTAPLLWDFEHEGPRPDFDISYTLPSGCAEALRTGTQDVGIIPAAAYTTIPDLVVIPDIAIAANSAVRSILLVSMTPLEKIRSVALDNSSLTSVALLKVLFAKWWRGERSFNGMVPDLERMLEHHDAALLIGDPALKVDRSRYVTYDLAEEWIRFTGKPFVFAFWAVRQAALKDAPLSVDLTTVFQESRDHGLEPDSLDRIAGEWSPRTGLSETGIKDYLTGNIHYYLDPDCLEGLNLFYSYARECDVLPDCPALQFLEIAKPIVG